MQISAGTFENIEGTSYFRKINESFSADLQRLENSKSLGKEGKVPLGGLYSSFALPLKISFPLFEPKPAYSTHVNYFQPMFVDGERQPISFSSGSVLGICMRGGKLILASKFVEKKEGREYLKSCLLTSFGNGEFGIRKERNGILIFCKCKKKVENLISGKEEEVEVSFSFAHRDMGHAVVDKRAQLPAKVREIHGQKKSESLLSRLENFVIPVPHFCPHPYLLESYSELGFASRREMHIEAGKLFFGER